MDLSFEHISLFQKTQSLYSPSILNISYLHNGTAISYTQNNYIRIHCPITNIDINKINVPDIKKGIFLFDNTMLVSTNNSIKYLSVYDNTYLRSFSCDKISDIQSRLKDDVFMSVEESKINFYDLRSVNAIKYLNVKNSIATLNNDSFAILMNKSILKIYDFKNSSPMHTIQFFNINKIKITNNNKYILLSNPKNVILVNVSTGCIIHRFFVDNVIDFDFSEDSQFVFFLHDQKVSVFSLSTKTMINNLVVGEQKYVKVNPSFSQFVSAEPNLTFFSVDKALLNIK